MTYESRRARTDDVRNAQDDHLMRVVTPYLTKGRRLPIGEIAYAVRLHRTTLRERLSRLVDTGRLERLPGLYNFKIVGSETAKAPARWTPGSIAPPSPAQMMRGRA